MLDATRSHCRTIGTATWSDALDRLGIKGVLRGLTWRTGTSRIVGRAATVREDVGGLGGHPIEAFDVSAVLYAAGPGEVLVIDAGGAEVSTFGGLAAAATRARGVDGVIVDGACRDIEEIRATGLRLVTRHVAPTSGKGRIRVAGLGFPVNCGGVSIAPGDIVVADETGTVVVPAGRFAEVFALARELDERDRRFREALDAGQEFGAIAVTLGHL